MQKSTEELIKCYNQTKTTWFNNALRMIIGVTLGIVCDKLFVAFELPWFMQLGVLGFITVMLLFFHHPDSEGI
ncbi:MAG: hypothetical protein WCT26_00905 [Candidatus Buchananbacteria bacterium]|jgi:hypothetical protein